MDKCDVAQPSSRVKMCKGKAMFPKPTNSNYPLYNSYTLLMAMVDVFHLSKMDSRGSNSLQTPNPILALESLKIA